MRLGHLKSPERRPPNSTRGHSLLLPLLAMVCLSAGMGAAIHWKERDINALAAWLGCSAIGFLLWCPWILVWAAGRERRTAAPPFALVLLLCVLPPWR